MFGRKRKASAEVDIDVATGLPVVRYNQPLPYPLNDASPWWLAAGPVFYPGGAGAVLRSKLSKPQQSVLGYAYSVANPNAFNVTQPPMLLAPKGAPIVGINIQTGWTPVTSPAVNSDGSFVDQNTDDYNGTLTNESGDLGGSYQ
jgi:hypothetical protein